MKRKNTEFTKDTDTLTIPELGLNKSPYVMRKSSTPSRKKPGLVQFRSVMPVAGLANRRIPEEKKDWHKPIVKSSLWQFPRRRASPNHLNIASAY